MFGHSGRWRSATPTASPAEQVEFPPNRLPRNHLCPTATHCVPASGPLHRTDVGDQAVADHHAPGGCPCRLAGPDCTARSTTCSGMPSRSGDSTTELQRLTCFAPGVLLALGSSSSAGPYRAPRRAPVGDHIGHLRGVVATVTLVDVLDDLLAKVGFDIDVDIGLRRGPRDRNRSVHLATGRRPSPQGVADRRVGAEPRPWHRMLLRRQNWVMSCTTRK